MGKVKLVDLSQPFGDKCPLWPYFEDGRGANTGHGHPHS